MFTTFSMFYENWHLLQSLLIEVDCHKLPQSKCFNFVPAFFKKSLTKSCQKDGTEILQACNGCPCGDLVTLLSRDLSHFYFCGWVIWIYSKCGGDSMVSKWMESNPQDDVIIKSLRALRSLNVLLLPISHLSTFQFSKT